jgi:hypothetical protein
LVISNNLGKSGILFTTGCLAFSMLAFAQDKANTNASQSDNQQQNTKAKKKKKDKKSKQKAKKDDSSGHPMDERPPIGTRQPGRMDNPTIPQRTPGQQPAPGTSDPTSPTTAPR